MASIKDVATKAGVGVGTVSRVINNNGYVSDETRQKILQAMKELEYTPNELARNLYRKKNGIVAVLVPTLEHPFYSSFVNEVEKKLAEAGMKTMLCTTTKGKTEEIEYLDMLKRHVVDGIIAGSTSLEVSEYEKIKNPIVALDRYLGTDIPVVTANHVEGGKLAAQVLFDAGCRNVIQFVGEHTLEAPFNNRHTAFTDFMKKHGVGVTSIELSNDDFSLSYYQNIADKILDDNFHADAVFGVDMIAGMFMREAVRRGIRVPDDLKIVSYDGTYWTRIGEKRLTSIVQPIDLLAKGAVDRIVGLIDGNRFKNDLLMYDVSLTEGETI